MQPTFNEAATFGLALGFGLMLGFIMGLVVGHIFDGWMFRKLAQLFAWAESKGRNAR